MQVAVIGLGSFGSRLAETLHALGAEVIAIDNKEEIVEEVKGNVSQAICLDATDERALQAIGIAEVDVAVVSVASDVQASILVTTLLRQMGVTRIIARATSSLHARILGEVGASQVIRIEEQMAEQSAKWIIAPELLHQVAFTTGYSLVEVKPKEEFVGKKIRDLGLREQYNLSVAALMKRFPTVDEEGRSIFRTEVRCPPDPEEGIERDDTLVLLGQDAAILEFTQKK